MALENETPLPSPSCRDIETLESGVKHRVYERFYHALCSHWVIINELWLARNSRHRTSTSQNTVFEMISDVVKSSRSRDPQRQNRGH